MNIRHQQNTFLIRCFCLEVFQNLHLNVICTSVTGKKNSRRKWAKKRERESCTSQTGNIRSSTSDGRESDSYQVAKEKKRTYWKVKPLALELIYLNLSSHQFKISNLNMVYKPVPTLFIFSLPREAESPEKVAKNKKSFPDFAVQYTLVSYKRPWCILQRKNRNQYRVVPLLRQRKFEVFNAIEFSPFLRVLSNIKPSVIVAKKRNLQ